MLLIIKAHCPHHDHNHFAERDHTAGFVSSQSIKLDHLSPLQKMREGLLVFIVHSLFNLQP